MGCRNGKAKCVSGKSLDKLAYCPNDSSCGSVIDFKLTSSSDKTTKNFGSASLSSGGVCVYTIRPKKHSSTFDNEQYKIVFKG